MNFTHISYDDFARRELRRQLKHLPEGADPVDHLSAWSLGLITNVVNRNQKEIDPCWVLAERMGNRTVQVMSDIWENEFYREVLIFDPRRVTNDSTAPCIGLSWVTDGSVVSGCDCHYTYFHNVEPVAERGRWQNILDWVENDAGVEEAKRAGQKAADEVMGNYQRVERGNQAVVARGRKIPKGTKGVVAVVMDSAFGPRVGISTSWVKEGNRYKDVVWTALSNVDAIYDEKKAESDAKAAYKRAYDYSREQTKKGWLKALEDHHVGDAVEAAEATPALMA